MIDSLFLPRSVWDTLCFSHYPNLPGHFIKSKICEIDDGTCTFSKTEYFSKSLLIGKMLISFKNDCISKNIEAQK